MSGWILQFDVRGLLFRGSLYVLVCYCVLSVGWLPKYDSIVRGFSRQGEGASYWAFIIIAHGHDLHDGESCDKSARPKYGPAST